MANYDYSSAQFNLPNWPEPQQLDDSTWELIFHVTFSQNNLFSFDLASVESRLIQDARSALARFWNNLADENLAVSLHANDDQSAALRFTFEEHPLSIQYRIVLNLIFQRLEEIVGPLKSIQGQPKKMWIDVFWHANSRPDSK